MAPDFPWLTAIIALPALSTLLIPLLPDKEGKTVRWYALIVGLVDFALMCFAFWQHFDPQATEFQLAESYRWLPSLGIQWSVAVDGISAPLVLLAGFVTTLAMFSAWQVNQRPRLFYALMLLLYSAQIGVFVAKDLFLFFLMWEIELIPVYLLVCIWGGKRRRYAAMKFLLYTAAASIFILVAALALSLNLPGGPNFDLGAIAQQDYPLGLQMWLYAGLLVSFGVKLAIFPLHTWLPDAHGEASSPVSMLLAGVLLKMGGYGLMRFNMELLPDAHVRFAPLLVILGVVNIVYGAFSSFGQTNMKRRLAYSSVSHMGFVLIGIASFTDLGINGAMLQMLSHGLIASVLFFLAGVTYDRTKTMVLAEVGGLGQVMPKVFAMFTVGALASLALPGMSGFVGELSVFVGLASSDTYSATFRTITVFLAAVGVILTPIYLLSMLREMFYTREMDLSCDLGQPTNVAIAGNAPVCFGNDCVLPSNAIYEDARPREIFIATCFTVLIIGVGLYPKLLMQMYDAKTQTLNTSVRQAQAIAKQPSEPIAALQAPELSPLR
ncbi:NAD(P)H-quinone oxidoreductase subunit 4 [Picosynechococcus sp. PCC 73109]|uniref:NAD(P)H-quinone oxidoreductase subunit 4 n=1 Tax=Picosynechococcus sp. PCC 73109 TaxID=374982 RepID=UPI00074591BB|nr:NAD(P)H-quinone oxidoreductase subunit 4 [Picosynechococcus sp. PCC 73109]AMA09904.1 NAD(P)H-quinone oxidoreductase subunit 4 [Picosynechococcus sp. PCC 73109]